MAPPECPTSPGLTSCTHVAADQLLHMVGERRQGGARFVDLVSLPGDRPSSAVILEVESGYEVLEVSGQTLPSLQRYWPAAQWPDAAPADDSLGVAPPGMVLIGDAGPVTWRRLDLAVAVDGDRIEDVHARRGRLHGGLSGWATSHSYLQLPSLAETLNEHTPSTLGLLSTLGIEALLGIEATQACQHARVFVAELERLQSHCGWLVSQASATDDEALVGEARHAREHLAHLFVHLGGRRRATGIHLPGRILIEREGADAIFDEVSSHLNHFIDVARRSLSSRRSWRRRLAGVGAIEAQMVEDGALSGPTARATGLDIDVRRRQPYLSYDQLDFDVPVGTAGDVVDRCIVRLAEMSQSLSLARQALAASQGPLQVEDPRIVPPSTPTSIASMIHHFELWMEGHGLQPVPDATAFVAIEAPEGELGLLLRSDGTSKPAWAHWRSPAYYHFDLLSQLLVGQRLSDAKDLVASLNINAAEMDR
ncbi:MAG: hypothetical protein HOH74_12420 [Gemmatimonadetes bacterium]|nr:hypothetical protein [Gemmatimonadota bacterium]MBT6146232.1 hypothetical protein [Gemmatimonadota bacterium]